jgi:uncharacterized protein YcbK (DUF882 family)
LDFPAEDAMKPSNHAKIVTADDPAQRRRLFLKLGMKLGGAALAAGLAGRAGAKATPPAPAGAERKLRLYNTHTGEQTNAVYWAEGRYQADGLADINRLLRDHRSGEVSEMDTGLLDLMCLLSARLDTQQRFEIISGYRSPASNALLREHSSGVAQHSLHMDGLAVDLRVPGRALADVRRIALALGGGGVGYYPASDFVHVDVGRVRSW